MKRKMADKGDDDCLHRRAYSLSTSTLREIRFLSQQRPFLVVYFVGLGHAAQSIHPSKNPGRMRQESPLSGIA